MSMIRLLLLLLSAHLIIGGCGSSDHPEQVLTGATMGTIFTVKLVAPPALIDGDELRREIHATLQRVDRLASTYREDSDLSRFNVNESTDWIPVTEEFCRIVERALAVSRDTDGAFDITVGPLVDLWGFGPAGVLLSPPAEDDIAAQMRRVGYRNLATDCSVPAVRKDIEDLSIDLSGWAKGFAVDEVAGVLEAHMIPNYLVEIGGELRAKGRNGRAQPWTIGIEQPIADDRAVQTMLQLSEGGVATSGDYRNFFEYQGTRYAHTIDSRTGKPVAHNLAAVTVLHSSAARADALATALLVMGPVDGLQLAEELGLACFFQVRGAAGIEFLQTPQFVARTMP